MRDDTPAWAGPNYHSQVEDVLLSLDRLGVAVLEPQTRRETNVAQALGAFAAFCLEEDPEGCRFLIDKHIETGSAGLLQGDGIIYRLVLSDENDEWSPKPRGVAGNELLHRFTETPAGKQYQNVLTVYHIKQYMLGMCSRFAEDRVEKYNRLGNLMLILSFGPIAEGQIRHIDDMDPNVQICLYMSSNCPSTTIFSTIGNDDRGDAFRICNAQDLLCFWTEKEQLAVPSLVKETLDQYADMPLQSNRYTKYFRWWRSINATLSAFGKLYLPVQERLQVDKTSPGTTLIAPNNHVHAGPSTSRPRMFAFATGILDTTTVEAPSCGFINCQDPESQDGEVQYSPVLLHLDLCSILFTLMDFERDVTDLGPLHHAKIFLLTYLQVLIKDNGGFYGQSKADIYNPMFGEDRSPLRDWLQSLVSSCLSNDAHFSADLLDLAIVREPSTFYPPGVSRLGRKQRKKQHRRKGQSKTSSS